MSAPAHPQGPAQGTGDRGTGQGPGEALDPSPEARRARWEERYRETPAEELPWYRPDLDPDLGEALEGLLAEEPDLAGARVLDLGAGPGTQAVALARRGFRVTASDIAAAALEQAARHAREAGVELALVQDDILDSRLRGPFDLVLDRGCLHTLPREAFPAYAAQVARLLRPGGWLLLKCFSEEERREEGPPNRLSPEELRALLEGPFAIRRIERSTFPHREPGEPPFRALLCLARRAG